MSKKHNELVQKQFTKTREAFSVYVVRDTPEVLEEKIRFMRPERGERTLDVACGPGTLALAVAPQVRFACGGDLTFAMLRQALEFQRERGIANAAFACCDADHLPYPDGTFDLVTCQCAFHHMQKPMTALIEMARVMKPEGRAVIIDALAPESDAKFELHNRIERLRDPSHAESLRLTTFLRMFDESGLEIAREALRRRERSFNRWMLRAGVNPGDRRYRETRELMEQSVKGDAAGFSPRVEGDDITIAHTEGMFLLHRKPSSAP